MVPRIRSFADGVKMLVRSFLLCQRGRGHLSLQAQRSSQLCLSGFVRCLGTMRVSRIRRLRLDVVAGFLRSLGADRHTVEDSYVVQLHGVFDC